MATIAVHLMHEIHAMNGANTSIGIFERKKIRKIYFSCRKVLLHYTKETKVTFVLSCCSRIENNQRYPRKNVKTVQTLKNNISFVERSRLKLCLEMIFLYPIEVETVQ